MGDGNYMNDRNIIRIYSNSFTRKNVMLLFDIIKRNLNINNKVVHDRNNQYIIVIEKHDMNLTRDVTLLYMQPSMMYKLGIKDGLLLNYKFDYLNIIKDI
jgi:LAGLIDADG DNA endonuclease family